RARRARAPAAPRRGGRAPAAGGARRASAPAGLSAHLRRAAGIRGAAWPACPSRSGASLPGAVLDPALGRLVADPVDKPRRSREVNENRRERALAEKVLEQAQLD